VLHRLDENGKPLIRDFINIAREKRDDFFYDYVWEKYSTGNTAKIPKRAYVIGLPKWGWVLGTGVYMDDIDAALAEADKKASTNITRTMLWIFAITGLSLLIVISLGLALNIREQRDTLEKERERFAGELHEGIAQQVDAIKNHIETDILKLTNSSQEESSETLGMLEEMVERLYEVNGEIRRIAHGLYPEILTDLGLEKALRQLTHDYPSAHFTSEGEVNGLPERVALALYRTAQAALDNVYKHANARKIIVRLEGDEHYVTLIIIDDGDGFNVESHLGDSGDRIGDGIGLRSMKRRIENENGKLDITSSPGTTVIAKVPRKSLSIFLTNLFPWKSR
jgi:two-component system, NarL family, sensor kinase